MNNPKDNDWFENAVLISGQMKVGGTLFSCMLDGSPEYLIFPDIPEFRVLFQKEFVNSKQMATDWLLGFNNIFQGIREPIFNFNPANENTRIPLEYCDLPLKEFPLRGFFRGLESWENHFSMETYHAEIKSRLENGVATKKDVVRATVLALMAGYKDKSFFPKLSHWGYRGIQSALTSIFRDVRLQDNEVEEFFKTFPKGKAVFSVRNPHATVLSHHNHYKAVRASFGKIHRGISFLNDCKIVHESLKLTLEFQRHYSNEKLKIYKYEDIIGSPRETMSDIAAFIGIHYDDILIVPTLFGHSSKVITAFEIEGSTVDKSKAESWRKKLSPLRKLIVDSFMIETIDTYKKLWNYDLCFPRPVVWLFRILVLLPFLALCQTVGGRILSTWDRVKEFIGLSYIQEKSLSNVQGDEFNPQIYTRLCEGVSLHYVKKELARVAEQHGLTQANKVLIVGNQRNLFALHFAQTSELVHVVHSDVEFLKWLLDRAESLGFKNLTVYPMTLEEFEAKANYDLVFMQDDFGDESSPIEQRVKKATGMMGADGKLYLSEPGLAYPILRIVYNANIRRYKTIFKLVAHLIKTFVFNQILRRKHSPRSYLTRCDFKQLIKRNGLKIDSIGYVDTILEGIFPPKVGPFIRKWEALCKKTS